MTRRPASSASFQKGSTEKCGWLAGTKRAANILAAEEKKGTAVATQALSEALAKDNFWGVQAEWIDGELFGYDVRGWYGQFAYAVKDATPYCRYERYEPTEGVPGDTWEAVRLGCAWQLDKNNEVTFEYMWGERGDVDTGQWGVQWQTGL